MLLSQTAQVNQLVILKKQLLGHQRMVVNLLLREWQQRTHLHLQRRQLVLFHKLILHL